MFNYCQFQLLAIKQRKPIRKKGEKEKQRGAYNQIKHKSSNISNFLNLDLKTFKLFKVANS